MMINNTNRCGEEGLMMSFRQVGVSHEHIDSEELLLVHWRKQLRHILIQSESELVQELIDAVQQGATLSIFYQGGADSGRFRKFTPDTVFRKERSTVTYVSGYCHLRRANRVLRADRISMG